MAQVTITPENSSWTSTAGEQTGTVEGITVAVTNGVTGSTTAEGATMRIYKDATLTISSASNISKIVFNCVANNTTKYGPGCFGAQEGYSYDAKVGTWEGSATSVSFTASSAQVRVTSIVVTLAEGGDEPVEPGDEPVVEPAVLITFGDSAVDKGAWSNGAVIADKDSLVKLTLVDPDAKIAIDLNDANFGTTEEYVSLKSRLKTGGKSSSSKNYINVEVAKDGQLYIMARTGSNSATDRNVVITNGTDTIFNQLLLESNATVVPLTDTTSMKIYPVYSASLNAGVTYRISYPVNGVNFYGFDFVPEEEPVVGPQNLGKKTIAEFLALKNITDTCILTGVVSNIQNTTYGNFDLTDKSGKVYVYGLLTPAGESKKFADLNVAENDTLTVLAIYNEHNGTPQVKNAIFVEVKKSSAPVVEPINLGAKTIAEFLELKNTKDTCILTGVVANITNTTYGNFDLCDATDTVYIYGLLTSAGESKKFADLNVAEKDTLTLLAIYNEYNGKPQAKNAIFVEVKKAAVEPEINYYVAGSMNGWKADENYMLTPNNESLYEGEFTFAANDEFKVIGFDGTNTSWFPEGMGNNFKITEAGDYKITFNPAGNVEGWYEGFFNVVKKEEPVVKDTIQLSWSSDKETVEWKDATASQGWWQMRALSDKAYITLSNAGIVSETSGTYTVAQLDAAYSYMMIYKGTDTTRVELAEGSITVADDGAGTVAITGTLTGDDGNVYEISIISLSDPYKFDEEEDDYDYNFESYNLNTTYAVSNSVVLVTAETDTTLLSLYVIIPQGDTTLVAGEYRVVVEPAYGTVLAGSYSNNRFNPSFAATLYEEEGNLYYNQIWYLVSGKVTVDNNLNIVVDALNSNGKAVKANLKGKTTEGVEDVKAAQKATKALKNGILIIEKNGVQYNVTGQEIR